VNHHQDYFDQAASWAVDTRTLSARSRRIAWTIGGIAIAIAALEAVALAMLAPLKTVQPITLLVDRQTGFVQALDPQSPKRVLADDALTQSFLAQYVAAREGFDRATISATYRKVALLSSGVARSTYLAEMPATNPASPFQRYPAGTIVSARVKSVSKLSPGVALVRFDTQVLGRGGSIEVGQPWVAVIRYRYTDAPMSLEDRLVNPLGFQVLSYRRDAEAPAAGPSLQPVPAAWPPLETNGTAAVSHELSASPAAAPSYPVVSRRIVSSQGPAAATATAPTGLAPDRSVPSGSPLSSGGE
jgi:type IV secretion system protein VirB8